MQSSKKKFSTALLTNAIHIISRQFCERHFLVPACLNKILFFFFIKFIILQWKVVDQMGGNSFDDPYRPSKIGFVQILTLSRDPDIGLLIKGQWRVLG